MKRELQEIHTSVSNVFDITTEAIDSYKKNIEDAIKLIRKIPVTDNVMLENWKLLATDELKKELDNRLAARFHNLTAAEQKAELKFSKITVTNVLMNIIMNL